MTAADLTASSFTPRSEAHAMRWKEMLGPVRRAVANLLDRLSGTADRLLVPGKTGTSEAATSFLVYGDRGTGKTTVLLTAREATREPTAFFSAPKGEDAHGVSKGAPAGDEGMQAARDARDLSQRVVWLDVLDMEPLPRSANLLATLLVRVREELDRDTAKGEGQDRGRRAPSMFEEGKNSAEAQLDRLVQDATLMWEDIQESDTRNRANRQIHAAEIYARFRVSFTKAMEAVCEELSRRRGHERDHQMALVLPIDNIDRSTEHLYSIFKLAQMTSSPHLWLVLAGDRIDIDVFLQRAFWQELVVSDKGVAAHGKQRYGGEDETPSIARRQATALHHKVLPLTHRIKVDSVGVREALRFRPDRSKARLYEIFQELPLPFERPTSAGGSPCAGAESIPGRPLAHPAPEAWSPRSLGDLFDLGELLHEDDKALWEKDHDEPEKPLLYPSMAAYRALRLPARALVDLRQLASEKSQLAREAGSPDESSRHTVELVRKVIRGLTDASGMPDWASQLLGEEMVRRDNRGGTVLDLMGGHLTSTPISVPVERFESASSQVGSTSEPLQKLHARLHSTLEVLKHYTVSLSLDRGGDGGELDGGSTAPQPLSEVVGGWLMVLHDILAMSNDPLVYDTTEPLVDGRAPGLVRVQHHAWIAGSKTWTSSQEWPLPAWSTFLEMDLFRAAWKVRLGHTQAPEQRGSVELAKVRETLAVDWVQTVLRMGGEAPKASSKVGLKEQIPTLRSSGPGGQDSSIHAMALGSWSERRKADLQKWIEEELPLLLTPELNPLPTCRRKLREELSNVFPREQIGALRAERFSDAAPPDPVLLAQVFDALSGEELPDDARLTYWLPSLAEKSK